MGNNGGAADFLVTVSRRPASLFLVYTISPENNSLGKMVGIFVGEWHSYNVVESTADFHFEAFLFRQSCISGKKKRNRRRIFPYRVFTLTVPTHRQIENALTTGFFPLLDRCRPAIISQCRQSAKRKY